MSNIGQYILNDMNINKSLIFLRIMKKKTVLKKGLISVKREHWKNKYIVVAREKGRFVTYKKYTRKEKVDELRKTAEENRTFSKELKKRKLDKPYMEYSDYSDRPKIKKDIPYRYVIEAKMRDGDIIGVSSRTEYWNNVELAKDEAHERFLMVLNNHFTGNYDEDGAQMWEKEIESVKGSVVYYV